MDHPTAPAATSAVATISVPGRGVERVEPDLVRIRLGVVVVRSTPGDARSVAATAMDAVVAALHAGGVKPADVRTALVALDPVRDYGADAAPRISGYQLTNSVEAVVRSVGDAGALLDSALAAGATSVDGLSFELADPSTVQSRARRGAVADARARALELAEEAGLRLGDVVAIVEDGALPPSRPRPFADALMKSSAEVATPIAAGVLEVEARVSVTFAIA